MTSKQRINGLPGSAQADFLHLIPITLKFVADPAGQPYGDYAHERRP